MTLNVNEIGSEEQWEKFMDQVRPGSFLHSRAWGKFNESMGTKVFYLGVNDGEDLLAVALILKIEAKRGSFLFCPHGPMLKDESRKQEVMTVLRDHLRKTGRLEKCAFVRISSLFGKDVENEKLFIDLGFRQAPVHMMHPELSWVLNLNDAEDKLLMGMRKTTRYCIRKAEKDGVSVEVSSNPEDVEVFWDLYKATVDRQNFTPFSKKYLTNEFEVFSKDDGIRFFFARYNNEVVAAAVIVFYNDSAFYHHGASIHKYPKITAPYLLQWEIIREAKRRGCTLYNFWGVVPEGLKDHPWSGLSLFKRGFGGSGYEFIHAKDLVLSPKYWLNFVVETVRRKKRRL